MTNEAIDNILPNGWKRALLILAVANALTWAAVTQVSGSGGITVNFFDVGQGDAALIESPQGNQVLVDGGPDASILEKLGSSIPFYDRTIELVIMTHPHQDHIAGLIEVLKRYKVEKMLLTGVSYESRAYQELMDIAFEKEIETEYAVAGQVVWVDDVTKLDILYPTEFLKEREVRDVNESSVVFLLDFGDTEVLFTGDSTNKNEAEILGSGFSLDADIMKVGHHGAKTSSSEGFLSAISPDYAVISVGSKNQYGHPHNELLERLAAHYTEIFRTDEEGDIIFFSDGGEPHLSLGK